MTDFALLHGGGQGGWVWAETIAAMKAQSDGTARCLALDAPGCGSKRGIETSAYAFDDIAAELVADIRKAGLSEVVLVGHSQAGMELPQMAEIAPDLIRALVFVTCSAPPPGRTTLAQMGNGLHGSDPESVGWPVDPETSTLEERFRLMFCNDMDESATGEFLAKLGHDSWPAVCYMHADWRYDHLADRPVTYVQCLQDLSLPPEWQTRFAQRLHAKRIVRIDAGHQVMNTRPQALAEVLLAEGARPAGA